MATTIDTSTTANATGPGGNPRIVLAPSDASAIVCYANGSQTNLGTAQSPYTSWSTQLIGAATTRNGTALHVNSDDGVDVVISSPAAGVFYFHYKRSVNSWSNDVLTGVDGSHGAALGGVATAAWVGRDQQGRIWIVGTDSGVNNPYQLFVWHSTDGGATWTSDTPNSTALGENNATGTAAAIIGNYLVIVYDSGSGGLSYRRADVHGASIGAWSAAAAVTGVSGISTASVLALCAIPGGSTGMLAYSASGIKALAYDASTDTWAGITTLSSASADSDPNLVAGASGIVYAVWSQNAGANNNALVGAAYNGTWHTIATLEASGADRLWANAGYLSSGPDLALMWTEGTGSPWNVEYDSVAAPSSGGFVSGGGALVANAVLTDTAQIVAAGALVANATMGGAGQIVASATLQSNALISGAAQIVATGDVLQSNALLLGPTPSVVGSCVVSDAPAATCVLSDAALATVTLSDAIAGQ